MAQTLRLSSDVPAILGGRPAFPEGLSLVRPIVGNPDALAQEVHRILSDGLLTNGPRVRELERRTAEYIGVRHCVAVASCTAGLMLAVRASDLTGDVVVPSFTFAATVHAVSWNGLRPVFADVDRATLTLSPEAARQAVGVRTSAIMATHTFGTPSDVDGLQSVAREAGVKLFFDAAHAFGSRRGGVPVGGFGDAEIFSLSPTKVLVGGEGGIVATDDDVLAERLRIGRDYGNPGDYDCMFVGLNARMSELHAAVALASMEGLDERIARRNTLAALYREELGRIAGIDFPSVPEQDMSTFKDLTVLVDPLGFGMEASELSMALEAEGVETRRYYAPPVHAMRAYRHLKGTNVHLPVTEWAASRVLTLPLLSDMAEEQVRRVAAAISRIQATAARSDLSRGGEKSALPKRRKDTPGAP